MKRSFEIFALTMLNVLVMTGRANAADITINGVVYRPFFDGTAQVYSVDKAELLVNVKMLDRIEVDGETYQVTSIGKSAFEKCDSLKSVVIPSSVQAIGASAFSKCSSLESVNIPEGITVIENSTFTCVNL